MARTAPELSIDTSAPWLTLSFLPFSSISRRIDFSASFCSVEVDGGVDDDVAAHVADQVRQFFHDAVGDIVFRAGPVGRRRASPARSSRVASSLSPIMPSSRMAASTSCARSSAAFGSRAGDSRDGAFSRPASRAASDSVTSRARLAEIAARGRLDAIGARAEIDPVEIHFEDLVLGVLVLQPERQQHFLHLALQRAVRLQEQVLGQLLGQRRAALR